MEMGGIPLVAVLSQVSGLPAVFVRKEAKSYGTRKPSKGYRWMVYGWWPSKMS